MGCGQCSTGGCGSVKAVSTGEKTNYIATKGCSSGGCSTGCTKLNTFDWLSDMEVPSSMRFNIVEVKFKGGRKGYFKNTKGLDLYAGDFVVCEMPSGYHIGCVSLQGELVRLQMLKKSIADNSEITQILRVANEKDLEKHQVAINRDLSTMYRVRQIISDLKLNMKLSDVEYQSDNTKATFYYSSEERVDFRELIKSLAGEFKIRVEMRQISLRQEAARLGGIGSCGRELCCSTWLSDFKSIPTAAARFQNLSLNPAKLSGQCGRLKCCLNYELDTYIDALQDIPKVSKQLFTEKGEAYLQKTDIFRRLMWFSYKNDTNWYAISCSQVVEIMKMNESGKKPVSIEDLSLLEELELTKEPLNNELDRLDKKLNKDRAERSRSKSKRKSPRNATGDSQNRPPRSQSKEPNAGEVAKPKSSRGPRPSRPKPERAANSQASASADKSVNPNAPKTDGASNNQARKKKYRNKRNRPNNNNEKPS